MREVDLLRDALMNILEGSNIFTMIKEDIDTFIDKYDVARWLSLNQVSTIHEILLSCDRDTIIKRLDKYKELQLKRTSEKDRWQKDVDGKKAIDYFCDMVKGLFESYIDFIKEKIEDPVLTIEDSHHDMIYQSLIKTFDHIFVTEIRVLKEEKCLKS